MNNKYLGNFDPTERWAIVDKKGEVIQKFRQKNVAKEFMKKLKREMFEKEFKIKYIEDEK